MNSFEAPRHCSAYFPLTFLYAKAAKFPYVLLSVFFALLSLLLCFGFFWAQALSVSDAVSPLILWLPFLGGVLFLRRKYRQALVLDEAISKGVEPMGLWVTKEAFLFREKELHFEIPRKEVLGLSFYESGRPPSSLVFFHLQNGKKVTVPAHRLGYFRRAQVLMEMLQKYVVLKDLKGLCAEFDILYQQQGKYAFPLVLDRLQQLLEAGFSERDLLEQAQQCLSSWQDSERVLPEEWLENFTEEGTWDYGVNGVSSELVFTGFKKYPHWLIPLCRTLRIKRVRRVEDPHEIKNLLACLKHARLTKVEFGFEMNAECRALLKEWL